MYEDDGRLLDAKVDLLLIDPPSHIRRMQKQVDTEFQELDEDDIIDMVELFERILKAGGHGHIFCSFLHFELWNHHLCRVEHEPPHGHSHSGGTTCGAEERGFDTADTRKRVSKPQFEVEDAPMFYIRSTNAYKSDPRPKRLHHTNMVDIAVHFWRPGPLVSEMVRKVDMSTNLYPVWLSRLDQCCIKRPEAWFG